jgi:hypothetical protein
MASFDAILVIARTIRGLLANSRPATRFDGADFSILRSQDFPRAASDLSIGVSVYLHRIAFNTLRRNQPPRIALDGRRFRPPTPVDLHFLITAWAKSPEAQMEILGWAVRTLQDMTELPAGLLNRFAGERSDVFHPNETVELVGETLTPQELINIWEIAKANQQPSISYVARQVLIDSDTEMPDAGLVRERDFTYAQVLSDASNLATAR